MPWKTHSVVGERRRFMQALLQRDKSLVYWCRFFGISRKTAYKWQGRFMRGGARALADGSRRPRRTPRQLADVWVSRIRKLRQQHPHWGAKKIRAQLERKGGRPPSARTIGRWLKRLGLTVTPPRRARQACLRKHRVLTRARQPNEVWTADFKGWFCAGNSQRCEPLTVRDLFSRYGLLAKVLASQHGYLVQKAFARLFRQRGMPRVIRIDNGSPFASKGPAGLSRLSAWWVRLGIRVEFTRPGCPQDNGAHEQFHRVMKAETTRPTAATRQGQQHRVTGWLRRYNEERPHEALGQQTPAKRYRQSRRKFPSRLPDLVYDRTWEVRRVRSNGEIRWHNRKRFIGEAFVGQPIGLRKMRRGVFAIYFAHLLIGHLHEADTGAMRPARYKHRHRPVKKPKV